jgi:hypothetical protein
MAHSHQKILNKLLWKGKNKWLIAGAVFGTFLGFFLLLSALQFYFDVNYLLEGDANPGDRYLQINKKVSLFNTLGVKAVFDEEEIRKIREQPFVEDIGIFTANDFKAGAYSDMLGFYTEMFFESVPDQFLDIDEPKFRWSEGQKDVPVLISRDYLALYNFGFAPSQGLPQVTPSTIQRLKMDVRISGNGRQQTFGGKIVGFSDRINSILVPPAFMEWANKNFGGGGQPPSRLILKVENPLSKELKSFLKENSYEESSGRLIGGQFGILLNLVLGIVMVLGMLILLLSVLVFILNFQLLIAQGAADIRLLLETGHFPRQVSNLLNRKLAFLFGGVILAVFGILIAARMGFVNYFENQGFALSAGLNFWVWAAGIGFSVLLLAINFINIRKSVLKLA